METFILFLQIVTSRFSFLPTLFVYSPGREAPLCRQHNSTAPRAHNTGALLFFIHGVQSRFPDIFHTLTPEIHTQTEEGQRVIYRLGSLKNKHSISHFLVTETNTCTEKKATKIQLGNIHHPSQQSILIHT